MNTGDFFSRFLFYSLIVHVFVFGYLIFDPLSEVFSKKNIQIKNAIRVDSISLPELKSRGKMATQKEEPVAKKKPVVKETKKPKPSAKKPVKKRKPVPAVKTKKSKPITKKDTAKIKQEQERAMDKIKQLKDREQKQDQAIDKLEVMESIEQIKRELEPPKYTGEKISKGNAQEGEEVADFEILQYFTSVKAHISMYWSLPQELADKTLRAEIYTVINNEGRVLKMSIIKSSGNEDFDARVQETIERASPLPKPTTNEIKKLLSKGVVFKFPE